MAKKINGRVYFWVDTIFDEDMIYDIYEDRCGHQIAIPIDTRY